MLSKAIPALIGLFGLAFIGVAGIVAMEWLRPEGYNTQVINWIISIIAPTMALLVPVIIGLANNKLGQENKVALKENTKITEELPQTLKKDVKEEIKSQLAEEKNGQNLS